MALPHACELAARDDVRGLRGLDSSELHKADRYGSCALHWAAGSGAMARSSLCAALAAPCVCVCLCGAL